VVTQTANALVQSKVTVAHPESKILGRIITTKLVGVSFEERQEAISKVKMGDWIWLEREPDNPHDFNAIMVCRNNGEQLGYLNRYLASNLVVYFDTYGKPVRGRVSLLTGSEYDGYSLGVVISFKIPKLNETYNKHRKHQIDWED